MRKFWIMIGWVLGFAFGTIANAADVSAPKKVGSDTYLSNTQKASYNRTGDPGIPWDSPEYMECGLRCSYLEAVEKISTKSRHTLETYSALANVNLNDTAAAKREMDTIVPQFCDWSGQAGAAETPTQCQIRWLKIQIPYLQADRVAIKMNSAYAGELQNGRVYAVTTNGVAVPDPKMPREEETKNFTLYRDPNDPLKKPIVTSMAKYEDIRDRAELRLKTDASLVKGQNALMNEIGNITKVYQEEFYETREIMRDPNDPKAGTFTVVKTGADGLPVINMKKYKEAQTSRQTQLGLTEDEKKRVMRNLGMIQTMHMEQLRGQTSQAKKIYNNVRSAVLGAAKRGLAKFGLVPAPRPTAAPARTTASTPAAPKTPAKGAVPSNPANSALQLANAPPIVRGAAAEIDPRTGAAPNPNGESDIVVPAVREGDARPYFTVGYSDNVLGNEIQELEKDLGNLSAP